jgi:phosphinothricin acetyltransferase
MTAGPMRETRLRAARRDDLPRILEIHNDAVLTTTALFHYAPQTLDERQGWFEAKQAAGWPVVAVADRATDAVLGYGSYGPFRAWPAYKYSVEHSVYVHKDVRGRGIGRQVLVALLDAAEGGGYRTMIAGVVADNAASLALHRSLGFEEVARFRDVGFKFGRWLDLCFLQKMLPGPAAPHDG